MIRALFETPRPVPDRRGPALAGALVILLALPVFLVGGFPLGGWALAAVLWAAGEALAYALLRLPLGVDHLASSGLMAIGMSFRAIAIMVVLLAVTVADRELGVAAVLTFVAAYTIELLVSLVAYFGAGR